MKACIDAFADGDNDMDTLKDSASSDRERQVMDEFFQLCQEVAEFVEF